MKRFLATLLLLTTTLCSYSQSTSSEYIFELVSKDSGFTYSEIKCIATDKNNMLWFACNGGLYYHDTNKFTRFRSDPDIEGSIPSESITTIYNDSNDRLWFTTDKGLCYYNDMDGKFISVNFNLIGDFNTTSFLEYQPEHYAIVIDGKLYAFTLDNLESLQVVNIATNPIINEISSNEDGVIYIGCEDGSLYSLDSTLKNLSLIHANHDIRVNAICEHDNKIYIGYEGDGVDVVQTNGDLIKQYRADVATDGYTLPSNVVRTIIKRASGELWIGTAEGLSIIAPEHTTTVVATGHNQLPRNSIYCLHVDKTDAVWVGTWAGNVAYYDDTNYRFRYASKPNSQGVGMVHHFESNDDSTIWAASEWLGLSLYDYKENKFVEDFRSDLHIKTLKRDAEGNLWIGTIRQGLYFMDTKSKKISKITLKPQFDTEAIISAIATDEKRGEVWIGSRGHGLVNYNIKTKKYKIYNLDYKGFSDMHIWELDMIGNDLYICSDNGFTIRDGNSGEFSSYHFESSNSFDHCAYTSFYDEEANIIYIGTKEYGIQLFDLETNTFKSFAKNDILVDYQIYNITQNSKQRLWLSTNNGIYQYNPQTNYLKHFTKSDGLHSMRFHPSSQAMTTSDIVFFGSIDGFYYIDTNLVKNNTDKHSAFISNILINGEPISKQNCLYQDNYLPTDITDIKLSPRNNSLTFSIVSNNILKSENCRFRYRLKGYQDSWVECDADKDIILTQLPFGRYELEMQTRNNDEKWGEIRVINIKIMTPLPLKWYALMLYAIVLMLIALYIIREASFKIKAKRDVEIEREINIINNRTFDEKVKFFMNISHELRTPLSLINAPLTILEKETQSKESLIHINAIKRNTERLLRLTNQILDFRLLEVGKLKATMTRSNVVRLCRETYEYFEYQIKDREIDFKFEYSANPIYVSLDEDMVGKVIYNLIGNALKYSDEGTTVTLKIERGNIEPNSLKYDAMTGENVTGDVILITIEDAGNGIPAEQLPHIFERFYFNPNDAYSSSGIGLHMCMEYVNLHHGMLLVESEIDRGTKFTVVLPQNCTQEQIEDEATAVSLSPYPIENLPAKDSAADGKNQYKSTILIVDDNSEIRFYLKKMLGRSYNCVTAKNGQQGFDMAKEVNPQLIIMDVLMPIMGGVECVQKLREDSSMKLIPIIMLTGLTDDNTLVQGVKSGADAYLSKPINETLLFAHIERLLSRNSLINSNIENNQTNNKPNTTTLSFVQNIESIIEQNIQNNTLDVNYIAEQMQVSRSTLQRNFKNEMGMGVAEFIRDYRLRNSVKLMENGVYNIDELSVCVGFNSSSYFCKAFKDKYGETPKRYYESLKGTK